MTLCFRVNFAHIYYLIFSQNQKILFFYHIDDYQEDYLFCWFYRILLFNLQINFQIIFFFFLFIFIIFLFLFFLFTFIIFLFLFFLFCFAFFFFQFFSSFSSSFSSRRSSESRSSLFIARCLIFRKIKIFFFFFFLFFFFQCLELLGQSTTFMTCLRTSIFAEMYETKACEISKVIWFCLNLTRISAVERA